MTPSEIETLARQKYNGVGDNFFSQAELLNYLYEGCMQLATECKVIERTYTTTTTASTQEYAYPSQAIAIKRITYNGNKLSPITFREDDSLTLLNTTTTATGTPQYYFIWNETIYLRPVPDSSSGTLKIFTYNEPQSISITSTLEVPSMFHLDLVNFVVREMYAKDENESMYAIYDKKWADAILRAKRWEQKKKRGDGFAMVQDEESLSGGIFGII